MDALRHAMRQERRAVWIFRDLGALTRNSPPLVRALRDAGQAHDPALVERCDIPGLARLSDGYSGAEVAAAVVEAAYSALSERQALATSHLAAAIGASPPLSKTRAEDIGALRSWAEGRARLAR